ncbi:c-type cytochrome [Roseomonas sp. OT10]|uniref:cytochrome c oxidase subunit II n=1 Tax=Roseomonas cutis TaxID=2897332 RepID=UPI001E4C3D95|nr:cytochrome c oxidase subunit II [Roseomonas sp. OT10]UFN51361.1 c-type cytochrome [Roseomonas sp. OT10]
MLALAPAGCAGPQSVLDTRGPGAAWIAELTHVLFAGGSVILALTMVATWLALSPNPAIRRAMGRARFVVLAGVVFPLVTLSLLLVYVLRVSHALTGPGAPDALVVEMVGRQFWWEIRYPGATEAEGFATANELRIPVGREVELKLTAGDVIHSVWIPNLHGKVDMIPGRTNTLRIRMDAPGVLRGQCTEFCGIQHGLMAFSVVAEPPEAFAAWLARQRDAVPEPATPQLARGRAVFGEAGCGACHAVRGTEWAGVLGPDLSRVGGRLTLGAGALENHRGTMAGWIAGAQDIKPGNLMPAYGQAMSGPDLIAVSDWLESLR